MKKLYKFSARWGRADDIEGVFAAEEADIAAAIGVPGYLEEPLGRHSSGGFTLAPEHLKVLTDDQAFIAQAEAYKLIPVGTDPRYALKCGNCGDVLPVPYTACRHTECGWTREASEALRMLVLHVAAALEGCGRGHAAGALTIISGDIPVHDVLDGEDWAALSAHRPDIVARLDDADARPLARSVAEALAGGFGSASDTLLMAAAQEDGGLAARAWLTGTKEHVLAALPTALRTRVDALQKADAS